MGFAVATALWLVCVQVSSFMAGAYPTGRMRRRAFDATTHESDVRDGSHGLLVWAVGIVLGALLAISTASSLVGAATGVAATGAAAASSTGDLVTDRLLRSDKPPAQPITGETRAEIGRLSRRSGDFAGRCSGRQNCNWRPSLRTTLDLVRRMPKSALTQSSPTQRPLRRERVRLGS